MPSDETAIPSIVRECLHHLADQYTRALSDNLVGIYVHGSIAMGCFNSSSSDVDVLVVARAPLSLETKRELGAHHLDLAKYCAPPVELSVVLKAVLDRFVYPPPYEFHFSNEHLSAFEDGAVDFAAGDTDPDLAAHFVITKQVGITLVGEPAQEIFPEVPHAHYLDSLARDAEWCAAGVIDGPDEGECRVPPYAVLNYCRVLAYIVDREVTSKRTGGQWALARLPGHFHAVMRAALDEYSGARPAQPVPCKTLKEFAVYALGRIRGASG